MPKLDSVKVGLLDPAEASEADRIFRLAFGTFLGMPTPAAFAGDRQMLLGRVRAENVTMLAARVDGRLVGSNVLTRWGSFGFFGPLTVHPDFWDKGVAQKLMQETVERFDREGVAITGLFTFPHSPKHVGLYRKYGYWPGPLTALMKFDPSASSDSASSAQSQLLSQLPLQERQHAIEQCCRLASSLHDGLDVADEIHSLLTQRIGDVLLNHGESALDSFAICHHGPGSEGGSRLCYVKFAAARAGSGAELRFEHLLQSIDAFAKATGVPIEAGVSFDCREAAMQMEAHGYRAFAQGVTMIRPQGPGLFRLGTYLLGDWR